MSTGPRSLAGKPLAGVSRYAKQRYSSLIRHGSVCNTFQEPTVTSIIDAKKTTVCGESGFPSEFLVPSHARTGGLLGSRRPMQQLRPSQPPQ